MVEGGRVRLAVGGDVSLAGCVSDGMREHGAGWPFEKIASAWASADLLTFNWEAPVSPAGRNLPEKGLVVPEELVAGVADALPPLAVTLANNHAYDAGVDGVGATVRMLDALGVAHFGGGETEAAGRALRVVEVNGLRVGFLGRTEDCPQLADKGHPGPALMKLPEMMDAVKAATTECDCLVVCLHHGVEFVDWPAPHFMDLCREMIDAGATLVLGGHPHVPQGHEQHGDGHIFYCLGNLVFEINEGGYQHKGSPWTTRSVTALIDIGPDGVGDPEFVPYQIEDGRPVLLEGDGASEVLAHFAAVSADLPDAAAMQQHWRRTALRYLGTYFAWGQGTLDENGHATEETVKFLHRLPRDESRMFVRELFDAPDWFGKLNAPPWT
jgi:capsule synthesis protein PGA_cap